MSPDELREIWRTQLTVGLHPIANKAIGAGRSLGYELVKRGEYPVPVLKLGNRYRVRTSDLVAYLGLTPNSPEVP
jgi:hypothetical protein